MSDFYINLISCWEFRINSLQFYLSVWCSSELHFIQFDKRVTSRFVRICPDCDSDWLTVSRFWPCNSTTKCPKTQQISPQADILLIWLTSKILTTPNPESCQTCLSVTLTWTKIYNLQCNLECHFYQIQNISYRLYFFMSLLTFPHIPQISWFILSSILTCWSMFSFIKRSLDSCMFSVAVGQWTRTHLRSGQHIFYMDVKAFVSVFHRSYCTKWSHFCLHLSPSLSFLPRIGIKVLLWCSISSLDSVMS